MKTVIKFVLAAAVLAVIAAGVSPYVLLWRLNQAYQAHEYQALVDVVDYDALRVNLKTQLYAELDKNQDEFGEMPFLQESLSQVAKGLIDTVVDRGVTKENAERFAIAASKTKQGETVQAESLGVETVALGGLLGVQNAQDLLGNAAKTDDNASENAPNTDAPTDEADNAQVSYGYCGVNCFLVAWQDDERTISAQLERRNVFGWKVVNVVLPFADE
ncbi:hypothetical protein B0181_00815 [Moraxella caviae]|uniref:Protein of uncharacterized function (DUF2939) n=1 Tax=Moraxella caviae TaxID=34060 RepID=A0A1T0ABV6_9GAMM|nr:DUF2939 domain-containing protein [Moraxella caviae]OOR93215.1 hypothetical protein B0181_00815 [Moraxella caviae]STZ10488.1 Protein of uncharacterised function (DUF2939) [Moraxella caviae]